MTKSYVNFTETEKEQLERWTKQGKGPGEIAELLNRDAIALDSSTAATRFAITIVVL